jgi:hypothetical protein
MSVKSKEAAIQIVNNHHWARVSSEQMAFDIEQEAWYFATRPERTWYNGSEQTFAQLSREAKAKCLFLACANYVASFKGEW